MTTEDLRKILHQTTLQSQLCTNPILVSVEELQKVVDEINKEKVNTQEPPSQIPTATSEKPQEQQAQDASAKADSTVIVSSTTKEQDKEKIGQKDTSTPTAKIQGAPPLITIIDQGRSEEDKEDEKTPKEREHESIQILVNFPTTSTPTKKLRIDVVPLKISAPGSSSTKVARVIHHEDLELDEEIVISS